MGLIDEVKHAFLIWFARNYIIGCVQKGNNRVASWQNPTGPQPKGATDQSVGESQHLLLLHLVKFIILI